MGEDAFDFLNSMLQFNPYFRPTVDECLEHPYMKEVRMPSTEAVAGGEVFLEIEKEDELSVERLRLLFL